jgi:hypothetical protein
MAFMLMRADVGDYDAWKPNFDADPVGRRQVAKGHRVMRNVEDPNEVFIQVEFASTDDAKAFRERLLASGALDRMTVKNGPTVTEVADETAY